MSDIPEYRVDGRTGKGLRMTLHEWNVQNGYEKPDEIIPFIEIVDGEVVDKYNELGLPIGREGDSRDGGHKSPVNIISVVHRILRYVVGGYSSLQYRKERARKAEQARINRANAAMRQAHNRVEVSESFPNGELTSPTMFESDSQ